MSATSNLYAIDGLCHNAEPGTYSHECSKPAVWVGTKSIGFASGFCEDCKERGWEARSYERWERLAQPTAETRMWYCAVVLPDSRHTGWAFFSRYTSRADLEREALAGAPACTVRRIDHVGGRYWQGGEVKDLIAQYDAEHYGSAGLWNKR